MAGKFVAGVIAAAFLAAGASAREHIYVFYPSTLNPGSMQEGLAQVLQGVEISVFGRYDDLMSRIRTESPDAVISKTVLIREQLDEFEIVLEGERNGSTKESYVLISADRHFSVESVNDTAVIGVMDILGRAGMRSFLKRFFPVEPKLTRVARIGDLLPVLSLGAAHGIVIEKAFVEYLESTSRIRFSATPLNGAETGIVAFAVKKGGKARKTLAGLKKNDVAICNLFHIERWK